MSFKAIDCYSPSGVSHIWRDKPLNTGLMWSLCGCAKPIGDLDTDPKSAIRECARCARFATFEYNREAPSA